MAKKPLEIDACAGSQLRDTQGEMLSVEGADISDLEAGKGRWNDNHGKGFFNSIGRITGAKKIFKAEDCENDRQKYYWDKVKAPYIYVRGYLYSDEDHPNAKAAAAILRNIHKSDTPLKLKASVEGGVIARGLADPAMLARTKIHSVALTFTPANNATLVEPLTMEKSLDEVADLELMKSVMHLAETDIPSFRHIVRDASAGRVRANLERIVELMKGDDSIDIPTKQEILQYSLEAKIQTNVAKIHEMIEQIRHENMEKGLKEAIVGATMAGAAALAPQQAQAPGITTPKPPAQQQVNLARMPANHQAAYQAVAKKNPYLGAIGQIESSGGTNYAHKTIAGGGMHHGHTAGGMFGMMPNAAEYILRHDPKLAQKYPKLLDASKDMKTNHGTFTKTFNEDPQAAIDFAEALFKRNKTKTKNPEMLIHSWNHGLKGTWNKFKNEGPDSIKQADYVKNVMKVLADQKAKSAKPKQAAKKSIKKALTAGYGGAAAPMSRVGGAVIQSESLDDGRGGFKYVTCDGCGKEQIYAKHQVKCRECKKSWSLDKLHQVMLGKAR